MGDLAAGNIQRVIALCEFYCEFLYCSLFVCANHSEVKHDVHTANT